MKKLLALIKIMSSAGGGGAERRRWSPLTHRLLPIAYCLVFIASCLLPIASSAQTTYTLTGNMCGDGLNGDTCIGAGSTGTGSGLVSETYPAGTKVTLTPSAKTGYVFVGWLGEGLSGNKTTSLIMDSDKFVAAIFEPIIKRKLYVSVCGTGNGKITSTPAGIDCGVFCMADYNENTKVILTATPSAGSIFKGWRPSTLGCTGTIPTCAVSMTKAKIATALFAKP